jgi:hypothetical protein
MEKNDKTRSVFNEFVKCNLKSEHFFNNQTLDKRLDILNTYWDYLEYLKHEQDRSISFIVETVLPEIKEYVASMQFMLFSKKSILAAENKIIHMLSEFREVLPEKGYIDKTINGGIQKAL